MAKEQKIGDPDRREEIKKILEELAKTIQEEVKAAVEEIKELFPHPEPQK